MELELILGGAAVIGASFTAGWLLTRDTSSKNRNNRTLEMAYYESKLSRPHKIRVDKAVKKVTHARTVGAKLKNSTKHMLYIDTLSGLSGAEVGLGSDKSRQGILATTCP